MHAFRNGPIEDVHAGEACPVCSGDKRYSHITQDEMKAIRKFAVDRMYALLWLREFSPEIYVSLTEMGLKFTTHWDQPDSGNLEKMIASH
jgi:hypothetical protein